MGNGDLISRDVLFKSWDGLSDKIKNPDLLIDEMIKRTQDVPAVDAVEVVRCRDCNAFGKSPFGHPFIGWCKIFGDHRKPDYYCASGRRKK